MATAKQPHHFYATTAIAWAVGPTRAEAIRNVLNEVKQSFKPDENGGIYVWSCKVELPQTAEYSITYYRPVNVPCAGAQDGSYKTVKGGVTKLQKVTD